MMGPWHDLSTLCDAAFGQQQRGGRGERQRYDSPVANNSAASSASISAVIASSPLLLIAGWRLVTAVAAIVLQNTDYVYNQ